MGQDLILPDPKYKSKELIMSSGCFGGGFSSKKAKNSSGAARRLNHFRYEDDDEDMQPSGSGSGGTPSTTRRSTSPKMRLNYYLPSMMNRNRSPARNGTDTHVQTFSFTSNGTNDSIHDVAHPDMCHFCFDILHAYLHDTDYPAPPVTVKDESYPLFVTWKIGKNKRLRGCIGTFNSLRLHTGLKEYAISSAFMDSRFPPISKDEVPRLSVSVSILHQFESAKDFLDWTVGMHGIRIEFHNEKGNKKTSTYLPEVAPEQNWDQLETIDSLLRKAGYKGPISHDVRRSLRITRYKSHKLSVTYQEYIEARAASPNGTVQHGHNLRNRGHYSNGGVN